MIDQTVTPDAEAEWLARMKAAKAGRIPDDVYDQITEDMRLTSVMRIGGLSHLRLYWVTLKILEEVTAAGHWTPQQASDLIATTVEIGAKEGKPPLSQRVTPATPEDWHKLGGERSPT